MPEPGGWLEQSLALLVQLTAIDAAYDAFLIADRPIESGGGFAAMTETQKAVYLWVSS